MYVPSLCCVVCSETGKYIGVGTASGSVLVYTTDLKVCICVQNATQN